MRCERIKEWMGDHLDGCLAADRTRELNEHLAGCADCHRELEELRQTVALLRDLSPVPPPADLLASVHRRLARRRVSPLVVFWRVLSQPPVRVAAAAALVVVVGAYGLRTLTGGHAGSERDLAYTRPIATLREPSPKAASEAKAETKNVLPDFRARRSLSGIDSREKSDGHPGVVAKRLPQATGGAASVPTDSDDRLSLSAGMPAAPQPVLSPAKEELAAAAPVRAPEAEATGRIWGGHEANDGLKQKAVSGLTAGDASALAEAPANRPTEAVGARETAMAAPVKMSAGKAGAAASTTARPAAELAEAPRDRLAKADTYEVPAQAAAPVPAPGQVRELVLVSDDAAAVRKILAQYAVRGEANAKHKEAANISARGVVTGREEPAEPVAVMTEWVPAARYAQLLASLQAVGAVKPIPETKARAKGQNADLLLVKIRLVSPAK